MISYPEHNQYVNIHAHRLSKDPWEWVLTSVFADDYPPSEQEGACYSVGLHPRHIARTDARLLLKKVQLATENLQVLAIGEAGLDKLIEETPLDVQLKYFEAQVEIAEYAGLAVIIHAVRAFNELSGFMRAHRPVVPMIIHGYRGSARMAEDLLKAGFYLSIGHAVLKDEKTKEAVRAIPVESLLLETDEHEVDIREVYETVAGIKDIAEERLRVQVKENTRMVLFRKGQQGASVNPGDGNR